MAKRRILIAAAAAAACVYRFRPASFVPAPARHGPAVVAATAAALGAAPSAFAADKIDEAAVKLSSAAYPFMKEVNWNSDYFASLPGAKPEAVAKAIAKTLEMGAAMDGAAVKAGVKAHADAIGAIDKDGVTSAAAFQKINAAIGHMVASAGEAKTLAVYNAWKDLVPAGAPAYLKSTVNGRDAEAAYKALMDFKDVVKSEAGTGAAAPAARAPDAIDAAAKTLSEASYPFMKEVDWNADYFKAVPGVKPTAVLKAVQKALVQGVAMDPAYLKEGALAHAKAIQNVDAKGVLPLDDLIAVNAAIGHMIKSSGEGATMNTFNAFKGLIPDNLPSYLISTVNPGDAQAAYSALLKFKDVVKSR